MHITFVCTGNTCRSPMAQGLFEKIIKDRNLENITCSSCGIYAYSGDCASENAVKAAAELGADISLHRSRSFSPYISDETDLFVCMTENHATLLRTIVDPSKVTVLGDGISDPYGGDYETYLNCAEEINSHLEILADRLIMEIVSFDESSVEGIAELEKECFSAPWSVESIRAELENDNAHFLVAKAGDKVIGYMGVHEIAGEGYIANIAVSGKYRRMKIGSALMSKAEADAKSRGCEFISLEVRQSNHAAISLYEKRGYTVRGVRKNFYSNPTEDGVIMTLEL